jgi:hypothetical protein
MLSGSEIHVYPLQHHINSYTLKDNFPYIIMP